MDHQQGSEGPVATIRNAYAGRSFSWTEARNGRLGSGVSGIYSIHIRFADGTIGVYIGKSRNISERWKQHTSGFVAAGHAQVDITAEYNKLGASSFGFFVLEEIDRSMFDDRAGAGYFEQCTGLTTIDLSTCTFSI